jgi:hypothetical protein
VQLAILEEGMPLEVIACPISIISFKLRANLEKGSAS